MLQKIIQNQATFVVLVPDRPTQAWYRLLAFLLIIPAGQASLNESTETTNNTNDCTPSSQKHVFSYLFTVQQQLARIGFIERSIKVITAPLASGNNCSVPVLPKEEDRVLQRKES